MMRNVKGMVLAALAGLALVPKAPATVTLASGAAGIIRDQAGSMVSLGSIGLLVADTDGNGLVNPWATILAAGNTLANGSDDLILGVYQAVDLGTGQNGFDLSATIFSYADGFAEGDALWLVWIPALSTPGAVVGADLAYGTFRTDAIDELGTMAWIAPADGTDQSLFSLDADLGGNPVVAPLEFTASYTSVPEPACYSLLVVVGLAGIILARLPRRRFAA